MKTMNRPRCVSFEIERYDYREKLTSVLARNGYQVWEESEEVDGSISDKWFVKVAL